MSQDNKNLMLPTQPPTWLRAMNELCDLSYEVLNALVFLCRKPWDNPQTSSAVRVSWAPLHGVWYMKHHTAPQLLRYFIAIAAQPASSTVFFEQQFFLTNNEVFYISQICRALVSLAAVIQPNSTSTEEMLFEACTVYSLLVLKHWNTDRNVHPPQITKDNVDVTAPPILGAHRFDYRR